MSNTVSHASGCVIGVVTTVVVGSGDAGSKPCQTVIGAGWVSAGVGAGGLCSTNIDVTLINSDMASLLMSVIVTYFLG
jgi:hypothetical protein